MALIARNKDGTYATACALCGKALTEPIFATSHFIADKSHDLYQFSDAAMHWECYVRWPDQSRFAAMYFEARSTMSHSENWPRYWPVLWSSLEALVQYGLAVDEVSVILRKSGTDIRIKRGNWPSWLGGEWRQRCRPGVEYEAVAAVLPELQRLSLPQPSGAATRSQPAGPEIDRTSSAAGSGR
jgi:hypothetical protein